MLQQLRDKKTPKSTYIYFISVFIERYDPLQFFWAPRVVNGFIEFQKQQSDPLKPALIRHLQLLMGSASTYTWWSVWSFRIPMATTIQQQCLWHIASAFDSWSNTHAICEASRTFFTHQDLRIQFRSSSAQWPQNQVGQQFPSTCSMSHSDCSQKESYCQDWNYTTKCSCSTTSTAFASNHAPNAISPSQQQSLFSWSCQLSEINFTLQF